MERTRVCLSCHREIPDDRLFCRFVSQIGPSLDKVPKNDPEHRALISRAMFVAADVEIFGTMAAAIVGLLLTVWFHRRRQRRSLGAWDRRASAAPPESRAQRPA